MPHLRALSLVGLLTLAAAPWASAKALTLDDAFALHGEGKLAEALAAYRAVAPAIVASDADGAAYAWNNACAIANDRGEFRAALADCERAEAIRRRLGDALLLARTLNNLGLARQGLGDSDRAVAAFEEALALDRRENDALGQAIVLSNLGTVASDVGRYGRALALHREALAFARAHASEPWAAEQIHLAQFNEGVALAGLGAFDDALGVYRDALESPEVDPRRRAAIAVNAGVIYRNLGDPVRASELFERATQLYESVNDDAGRSNARLNLGLARAIDLARPKAAEAAYREALALARSSGDLTEEIQDLVYLGRLLLRDSSGNRLAEAEGLFREAADHAHSGRSSEGTWGAWDGLGRVARRRGDPAGALEHFERAIREIEQVRGGVHQASHRASYLAERRGVYAAAVEAVVATAEQNAAERALGFALRAKARELLDALGAKASEGDQGGKGGSRTAPTSQRNESPELEATRDRRRPLSRGGSRTAPFSAGDDLSMANHRGLARDRRPILEYLQADVEEPEGPRLHVWRIDRREIVRYDLGPSAPILARVRRVHAALSEGRAPESADLAALGRSLLTPLPPTHRGTLRIAPDGALRYLPFELLVIPGSREPLVERATVSYLPSAWALAEIRARSAESQASPRALTFFGLGAPSSPLAGSGAAMLAERFRLGPLPASAAELVRVSKPLGGAIRLALGAQATEAAFRDATSRGLAVAHFATHTVLDERPGRGAAILLTGEGADDGLLEPDEIASRRFANDLTVLAACRSALPAEGASSHAISSLTGAFLAAGSSGVVATLWDVGDRATAGFMEVFYRELARGLAPDEALTATKRHLRRVPGWDRPEIWAAYVVIGDSPPLVRSSAFGGAAATAWWGLGFFFGLAAIVATVVRRFRSSLD